MSSTQPRPRHQRLWLCFSTGFLAVFVGMLFGIRMDVMLPSGDAVVGSSLWYYYLLGIRRFLGPPQPLGPSSSGSLEVISTAFQHVVCSILGGAVLAGIGWAVLRFGRRARSVDEARLAPQSTLMPSPDGPALGEVTWRARVVVIGLIPVIGATALLHAPIWGHFPPAPGWIWAPLTLLMMVWMLAYPLRAARVGMPSLPRLRTFLTELLLAFPAVLVVMLIAGGVTQLMMRLLGSMPASPLEPILGSAEPWQPLALAVLSILVAPFAEEVFYRGMLYNALRQRLRPTLAGLIQAAVFGLVHPFGLAERAAITAVGFSFAMLYEWRKTLLSPILLHAAFNAVAMGTMLWAMAGSADTPVLGVRVSAQEKGCLVIEVVPGGAAEVSGLRVGDVITAVADEPVRDSPSLIRSVREHQVGDAVDVDYIRGDEEYRTEAILKRRAR